VRRKTLIGLVGLIGLGFLSLAVFAQQLGVGRSSDWGPGRKIVAGAGFFLILLATIVITLPFWQRIVDEGRRSFLRLWFIIQEIPLVRRSTLASQATLKSWKTAWDRMTPVRGYRTHIRPYVKRFSDRIGSSPLIRYCTESEDRKAASAAVVLGALVILIYIWFVSVGYWTNWPKTTSYYMQLSDAFTHGQVSLLVEPDPALLSLEDPYTLANRENISYPWDVVFYQGKFYLYWGPVPALVISAARLFSSNEIGDHKLVFAFVTGAFLVSSLFILRLRIRFFSSLGWVYVIPGILLAGFANPMPWLLNRPAVYEAAIASGQFFLLSGLFLGYLAFEKNQLSFWKLLLSGACLTLAVASRASLAFAAAFLAFLIAGYILLLHGKWSGKLLRLTAILLPLLIGVTAIGWYNKIRFGNWFEFGFRYQLTGMNTHIHTFSPFNLLINLHNYLLNPYRILTTFPYIKPGLGGHFIFFPIVSPSNYYSEHVTGMLLTVPFIVFAGIPVIYLAWYAWQFMDGVIKKAPFKDDKIGDGFFRWTAFGLTGASLLAFAPILFYIAGMMRFLGDASALIIVLSVFGLFMGRQYLEGKSTPLFLFKGLVIILTLYSIIVSLLLAVTGAEARFEHLNPVLFEALTRWFTP
jgi:hypothetical protein